MLFLNVEPTVGSPLDEIIGEMFALRDKLGVVVQCTFNGVDICAYPHSTVESITQYYRRTLPKVWNDKYAEEQQ